MVRQVVIVAVLVAANAVVAMSTGRGRVACTGDAQPASPASPIASPIAQAMDRKQSYSCGGGVRPIVAGYFDIDNAAATTESTSTSTTTTESTSTSTTTTESTSTTSSSAWGPIEAAALARVVCPYDALFLARIHPRHIAAVLRSLRRSCSTHFIHHVVNAGVLMLRSDRLRLEVVRSDILSSSSSATDAASSSDSSVPPHAVFVLSHVRRPAFVVVLVAVNVERAADVRKLPDLYRRVYTMPWKERFDVAAVFMLGNFNRRPAKTRFPQRPLQFLLDPPNDSTTMNLNILTDPNSYSLVDAVQLDSYGSGWRWWWFWFRHGGLFRSHSVVPSPRHLEWRSRLSPTLPVKLLITVKEPGEAGWNHLPLDFSTPKPLQSPTRSPTTAVAASVEPAVPLHNTYIVDDSKLSVDSDPGSKITRPTETASGSSFTNLYSMFMTSLMKSSPTDQAPQPPLQPIAIHARSQSTQEPVRRLSIDERKEESLSADKASRITPETVGPCAQLPASPNHRCSSPMKSAFRTGSKPRRTVSFPAFPVSE